MDEKYNFNVIWYGVNTSSSNTWYTCRETKNCMWNCFFIVYKTNKKIKIWTDFEGNSVERGWKETSGTRRRTNRRRGTNTSRTWTCTRSSWDHWKRLLTLVIDKIKKFEKNNPDIAVNVFYIYRSKLIPQMCKVMGKKMKS